MNEDLPPTYELWGRGQALAHRVHRGRAMPDGAVRISVAGVVLRARLTTPSAARGLVVIPHSGVGHSLHDRGIALALHARGLATLRVDLLTPAESCVVEEQGRSLDVDLLAERLNGVTDWARRDPRTTSLAACYFASREDAAVALVAAAWRHDEIRAVVSCSGRPLGAAAILRDVETPTLVIVECGDAQAFADGRAALRLLGCHRRFAIVPALVRHGAGVRAIDPAQLGADWFLEHLPGSADHRVGRDVISPEAMDDA